MQRQALKALVEWKKIPNHKPLIIKGARQVGKTWIMKEFGRLHFKQTAYINFDSNAQMANLFSGDYDIKRLIRGLEIESGIVISPPDTLLIFDEIQECPRALTSLKYFNEKASEYSIIAAGSLLGVATHEGTSFPVGKVDFLDLYPLNYSEFLKALGENRLLDAMEGGDYALTNSFALKYSDYLRTYYFVGGMPEAAAEYIKTGDYAKVRHIQENILTAYEQDFSKHIPSNTSVKAKMLWNSIPAQLTKENHKFIYGIIRHGARAKEYETALAWICDCGLAYRVHRISKPGIPLKAYEDMSVFKLYICDVGLLGAMCDLDIKTLLEGNRVYEEFKGSLSEQYVLQQLKTVQDMHVSYWAPKSGLAEVDFIVQSGGMIIPVEVKAEENLMAKSLKSYREKYKPEISVRTSMTGFRTDNGLINIPLYLIPELHKIINKHV